VDFDPGTGVHNKTATGTGAMDDVFVEKFNSSGNFQWVKSFGGTDDEYLMAMHIDAQGNIYTTGDYFMQVDFDPGPGTYFLTSHMNGNDIWVQKLNPSGDFVWAVSFGNNNNNTSFSIVTDDNLNVYTAGVFEGGYIDLNPGADTAIFDNFNDNGGYQTGDDIFIQKLDSTGAFMTASTVGGTWFEGKPHIVIDDSLNIIVTGNYESDTLYSDFSYQNYLINNGGGGNDIFMLKLSQFGELFTPSATNLTSPPFDVSFTVNIDDTTNLKWFWSFDDGNFSNLRQPTHTYAYNGTYTVSLLVEDTVTGITDTAYHQIVCSGGAANPCNFQAALNQTGAAIICASDSFMLSVQQQSGATYSWFYNGITILGAHSPVYYGKQQGFYMAVVTKNGCSKTTDYFALANYPVTIPAVTVTGTIANCSNDSVKLSASTNYSAFLWNTGDTAREIYTSVSGRFVVKATDANGCLNTSPETVINASLAKIPSICAVSTDGVNPNNIVSWKKEVSQKVEKYNVYKESTVAGVYQLLGSVNYSATPEFRDTVSNVAVRQYRYKITAVDTCGKETPVSLPHTTMHLMVNEAPNNHWNLIWRPYVGFNYTTYNIYRGTDSLNMSKIATISASNTSYTDLTNPTGDIFYQIEVVSTDTCNAKGGTPVSRSNNFNTRNASGLGIKTLKGKEMSVRIYPNPNKGDFYLRIEGENPGKMNISVYNILGKKVYSAKQDFTNGKPVRISTGDLPAGVYFIDLSNDSQSVYRSRIIIQR
jgi:PKD repeat protein